MKKTISENDFMEEVRGWESRKDQFSIGGWRALYRYIENLVEECGTETELDIVALCCEFAEYGSAWEAMKDLHPDDMPVEGEAGDDLLEIEEKNEKAAREWLEWRTIVIDIEGGGVIIQQF